MEKAKYSIAEVQRKMDDDDLVSVYEGRDVTEAYFVKNLLGERGIEAAVSEQNEPLAGLPVVAPDVLVRRKDVSRAKAVIDEYEEHQIEQNERPEWTCPACGERVESALDECYSCGAPRPKDV